MDCGGGRVRRAKIFASITIFILVIFGSVKAQETLKFGTSLSVSSSGSGFGTLYQPGFFMSKEKSQVELAINIQHRQFNVSGAQITYEYCVFNGETDDDPDAMEAWELFFFGNLRFSFNALLSKYQMNIENRISPGSETDFTKLRFNATEGYLGFGTKLKIESNLKWVNSIGIGGWATLKGRQDLYREYNSLSLCLKTGLSYEF